MQNPINQCHCYIVTKHNNNIVIRPQLYKLMYDCFPSANGAITTVQGRSSPFTTNPISFQLFGDSTGGPPTTNYWSRNGVNITNNSTFSISISFTGSHNDAGYKASNYQSTLTVTSEQPQPGTYLYTVSNRRTTGQRVAQIIVDGNYVPIHLVTVVVGINFSPCITDMCNLNCKG